MGTNGRGSGLASSFARIKNVQVGMVADVDQRAIAKGIRAGTSAGGQEPRGITGPVLLDEWGADAVWSGSQKCLGCPSGMARRAYSSTFSVAW